MTKLDESYWTDRYHSGKMGWDIGYPSTPLKSYIDQIVDKSIRILIPGAGNAYEAEYLNNQGFGNLTVIDISKAPLERLAAKCPDLSSDQIIHGDFFDYNGQYDLILEQTFFCALEPALRTSYLSKMNELLAPEGKLVGVLFNIELNKDRPPFGGNIEEYIPLFKERFELKVFETCHNSIPPRQGSELFINCIKT
ncbi:MAG: methyltransferase [Bacteroidota bacterium]